MTEQHKRKLSVFLSLVLRHKPEEIGLILDENGWADVPELLKQMNGYAKGITEEQLEEIVKTNNKKRFAFNTDKTKIRASQGHSIQVNVELQTVVPPRLLYHGTAEKNITSILQNGIQKMKRHHVHLSKDEETAVMVGARHGKPLVLTILSEEMYNNGFVFYLSENEVWLTNNVPPIYLQLKN